MSPLVKRLKTKIITQKFLNTIKNQVLFTSLYVVNDKTPYKFILHPDYPLTKVQAKNLLKGIVVFDEFGRKYPDYKDFLFNIKFGGKITLSKIHGFIISNQINLLIKHLNSLEDNQSIETTQQIRYSISLNKFLNSQLKNIYLKLITKESIRFVDISSNIQRCINNMLNS